MKRSDFHFDLPLELIAQEPRARGHSRMLVVEPAQGGIPGLADQTFASFPDLLGPGDVLVVNDTKVFPARLLATRAGNMLRPIELLLTRRLGHLRWECWAKPARRVRVGDELRFSDSLRATVAARGDEGVVEILFDVLGDDESCFWEEVETIGAMPLPPYIQRSTPHPEDRESYQTVYARERGAIAAPTAGLHFTEEILDSVRTRGVEVVPITLHVGTGTFKPVKVEHVEDHVMHEERYSISESGAKAINEVVRTGRRVVAVGTTSVRAVESAWRDGGGTIVAGPGATSIFIRPGYRFNVVSALLTNFHLPESTLLMLVSAFAGMNTIRAAYAAAIERQYRFYSFGDCMFIRQRGEW